MRSRKLLALLLIAVGVSVAFVVTILASRQAEPTYKGRPLAHWARRASGIQTQEDAEEARAAIFALCTNRIIDLANALDYDPIPRAKRWGSRLSWLPTARQRDLLYYAFPDRRGNEAKNAATALRVLGPSAAPAIPILSNLLFASNEFVASRSAWVLLTMGTNGFPPLVRALADDGYPWRVAVLYHLDRSELTNNQGAPFVPCLLHATADPDAEAALAAIQILGGWTIQPDEAMPVLTRVLTNNDSRLRYEAVRALARFGLAAKPAARPVRELFQDPDFGVRFAATNAFALITAESATNTPAR